jgi:multidrug efflux pump subunit AcrB
MRDARDVAEVPIEAGGRLLRLADVARVFSGLEDPPAFTVRHNGQPVLMLAITFERSGNILALGRTLDERLLVLQQSLPLGVVVEKAADQPRVVDESVWEFEKAFLEALAIVLAVCFLFLGWRTGIVVAASVPLVLAIVATVMLAMGWNLDRISLGALIIALGLLVDDAIIVVEMMVVKMEQGWDRVRAATHAYTSTALLMLTGTLITVAGFMPVGFARSIAGEYAGGIFWVVGVALIASWFVAVIFTPYLGVMLLPKTMKVKGHSGGAHDPHSRPTYQRLRRILRWGVAHRLVVLAATAGLFVLSIAGMGLVQQQFFPTASRLAPRASSSPFRPTCPTPGWHRSSSTRGESKTVKSCAIGCWNCLPETSSSPTCAGASPASSSDRPWDFRCSSASSGPTRRRCVRSPTACATPCVPARWCVTRNSTGTSRCARCACNSIRTRLGCWV